MVKVTTGTDATAGAASQAQTTSAEPDTDAKTPEKRAEETGEPQFFDGTVIKLDKDGNEVMSDHLLPGETLRRAVTDLHYANPAQAKANDEDARREAKAEAKDARRDAERTATARAEDARDKR